MLTLEALDRVRHRFDPTSDVTPQHLSAAAELVADWRHAAATESVLRRLARHRTGRDDLGAAFAPEELARLRPLLIAAGRAEGRISRSAGAPRAPDAPRARPLRRVVLAKTWTDGVAAITCTA